MIPCDFNKEAAEPGANQPQQQQPSSQPTQSTQQQSNSQLTQSTQQQSQPQNTQSKPADQATSTASTWGSLNGPLLYALIGGGLGAGVGSLFSGAAPGEDKEKRVKRRILNALILGGMGAGTGALLHKGLDYFKTDPSKVKPDLTASQEALQNINRAAEVGSGLWDAGKEFGADHAVYGAGLAYGGYHGSKWVNNKLNSLSQRDRPGAATNIINHWNAAANEAIAKQNKGLEQMNTRLTDAQKRLETNANEVLKKNIDAGHLTDAQKTILRKYHDTELKASDQRYNDTKAAIIHDHELLDKQRHDTTIKLDKDRINAQETYNANIAAIENGIYTKQQLEYLSKQLETMTVAQKITAAGKINPEIAALQNEIIKLQAEYAKIEPQTREAIELLERTKLNVKPEHITSSMLRQWVGNEKVQDMLKANPELRAAIQNSANLGRFNVNIKAPMNNFRPLHYGRAAGRAGLTALPAAVLGALGLWQEREAYNQFQQQMQNNNN